MRSTFLPFALPDTDHLEIEQIREAIMSGWITTGPKTKQFEAEFAARIGVKHAIAVNSCTAAMHLALEAIGLRRGDEVITTPYTFAASAEVIRYFDAKPVLVDINAGCFNISPQLIEQAITSRTRAIIPVHVAGLPCEMDAICEIAEKHDLAIIEDAAHAFPAYYKGRMIGTSPVTASRRPLDRHAACFSFYATKTITTAEGGMICTDNDDIADRCRIMALHGISRDAWKRYTAEGNWYYEIIAPGYKYNMTDVAAAMGLAQLSKAERMWQRRVEIAHRYSEAFRSEPALITPVNRHDCQHAWHLYQLRLNPGALTIDRAQFVQALKEMNIGVSVHFIPLHIHPYYRETYGYAPADFPVALREYEREVSLPIYSRMSDEDVQDVIDGVIDIARRHASSGYVDNNYEKAVRCDCCCFGSSGAIPPSHCHCGDD